MDSPTLATVAPASFLDKGFRMMDIDLDVPDELQSRLVGAAKRYGLSEHEFILKAIAEKLDCEGGVADALCGEGDQTLKGPSDSSAHE